MSGQIVSTPAGDVRVQDATLLMGRRSDGVLVPILVDTDGSVDVTGGGTAGGATAAKQDMQITAEQAILAKIIAAPATEAKQDTQITAEQAIQATAGATSGAAVVTDANGTIQQYLRGLVKLVIGFITVKIDQTTPGTTNAVQLTGAQLTPVTSTVTGDGSVAAGKFSVEFILSSDFAGTILTVAYAGANDAVKSFEAPAGRTLAAIAYTISAGSARLTTI